jgi:hypothetical protein
MPTLPSNRYQVPNFQILGLTSAFGSRYNTDTILPDANIPSLKKMFKCQKKNVLTKTLNVIHLWKLWLQNLEKFFSYFSSF